MADIEAELIAAAMEIAGTKGWRSVSVVAAAKAAQVPLADARGVFPSKASILLRFGRLADQAALRDANDEGSVRDRLFDLLMRRFDALQAYRSGVLAIMHAAPFDPCLAILLACATKRSMRWMLQAAGCSAGGLGLELRVKGLVAVWLWALRAWERDDTEDLTVTMAALDTALARAEQAASWLSGTRGVNNPPEAPTEDTGSDDDAEDAAT